MVSVMDKSLYLLREYCQKVTAKYKIMEDIYITWVLVSQTNLYTTVKPFPTLWMFRVGTTILVTWKIAGYK